jgi:hypothetical protein
MVKFIKTKIVLTTLIAGLFILDILLISDTYVQNGVEYTGLRYRPLIGGIQIEIWYQSSLWGLCILGYVMKEVYSGHCPDHRYNYCLYANLYSDKGGSGSPAYFWSYIEGVGGYIELYRHVVYNNTKSSFTLILSSDVVLSGGYKPLTG